MGIGDRLLFGLCTLSSPQGDVQFGFRVSSTPWDPLDMGAEALLHRLIETTTSRSARR